MVEIKKDIPIPTSMNKKFGKILAEMEMGESFEVSNVEYFSVRNAINFLNLKEVGKKFTTRTLSSSNRRIWRIE